MEDIKNLLDSLNKDIRDHAEIPCPVCKRPITKDMGEQLLQDTNMQIDQTSQELSELNKEMAELSTALKEGRRIKSQRDSLRIRLADLPSELVEELSKMSVSLMMEEIQKLDNKILDHKNEIKKIP